MSLWKTLAGTKSRRAAKIKEKADFSYNKVNEKIKDSVAGNGTANSSDLKRSDTLSKRKAKLEKIEGREKAKTLIARGTTGGLGLGSAGFASQNSKRDRELGINQY